MIKIISIFLLMLSLIAVQAFAETMIDTNHPTQKAVTIVRFDMEESYDIVIPASVEIPYATTETDIVVSVTSLVLASEHMLQVAADHVEGVLQHETDRVGIPYLLEAESGLEPLLDFSVSQKQNIKILIADDAWAAALPGDYEDAITFAASIIEKH